MFITYGTKKIKHKTIWFLADINDFTERKLYIFEVFSKKNKNIVVLIEQNKLTGEIFSQKASGNNADKIIARETVRRLYTSEDIKIQKGKPCGWVYGENTEIHNRQGKVIAIKQKRCDFFGQKEAINAVDELIN